MSHYYYFYHDIFFSRKTTWSLDSTDKQGAQKSDGWEIRKGKTKTKRKTSELLEPPISLLFLKTVRKDGKGVNINVVSPNNSFNLRQFKMVHKMWLFWFDDIFSSLPPRYQAMYPHRTSSRPRTFPSLATCHCPLEILETSSSRLMMTIWEAFSSH